MNCSIARDRIQSKLDRELDVELAIELGSHLALCAECREFSAEMEQLCAATTALPEFATRGTLTARAMTRAAPAKIEPRTPLWRALLYMGAAACVALLLGQAINWSRILHPAIVVENFDKPSTPAPGPTPSPAPAPLVTERPAPAALVNADATDVESGRNALNALLAQHYLSEQRRPEAERQRERRRVELLGDLRRPGKAAAAVVALLGDDSDPGGVWAVAASVSDAKSGSEVFATVVGLKVELRYVPIFIAALDSPGTRAQATEVLRGISGKRLGPQKEVWLAWWSQARSQARDD